MVNWLRKLFSSNKHVCDFGGDIIRIQGVRFKKCTHPGCNILEDIDLEMPDEWLKKMKKKYPNSKILADL